MTEKKRDRDNTGLVLLALLLLIGFAFAGKPPETPPEDLSWQFDDKAMLDYNQLQ